MKTPFQQIGIIQVKLEFPSQFAGSIDSPFAARASTPHFRRW